MKRVRIPSIKLKSIDITADAKDKSSQRIPDVIRKKKISHHKLVFSKDVLAKLDRYGLAQRKFRFELVYSLHLNVFTGFTLRQIWLTVIG